jgi:hypothetical protein
MIKLLEWDIDYGDGIMFPGDMSSIITALISARTKYFPHLKEEGIKLI